MTAPISCISSKENLLPRAKLHGAHEGATLSLVCPRLLSMRSKPLGKLVVPQCTQGCKINSANSSIVKSHSSMRSYAFLKCIALPLGVAPYLLWRAFTFNFCSSVKLAQRSVRLSRPFLRSRWHSLHSYASPLGRERSTTNISGVAGSSLLQRLQTLWFGFVAFRYNLVMQNSSLVVPTLRFSPHLCKALPK